MADHFPHVRVTGGPRERGRQYGGLARDRVHASVDLYRTVFSHFAGWDWDTVTRHAATYQPSIEAVHPRYLDEMAGIAEGAGLTFDDPTMDWSREEDPFANLGPVDPEGTDDPRPRGGAGPFRRR